MRDGSVDPTDFFVSYNHRDSAWAEWIAWQLEAEGFSTKVQAWDFKPGSNFVLEMDLAIRSAKQTLVVLSPNYLESSFTPSEWAAAFAKDPRGTERRLIPIRVEEFGDAGLLNNIVYIDLVGLETTAARTRLVAGVARERLKPADSPPMPQRPDKAAVSGALGTSQPIASPIIRTRTHEIVWRRDLPGSRRVTPLTVEVELVPNVAHRMAETRMQELATAMAEASSRFRWFTPRVQTETTADAQFSRIQTDSRWQDVDSGLLLTRYGQRGGWFLTGTESIGVLSPDSFVQQTATLLRLLASLQGNFYEEYVVAIAAGAFRETRLPAQFVVTSGSVSHYAEDIALEVMLSIQEQVRP